MATRRTSADRERTRRADQLYSSLLGSDLTAIHRALAEGWDPRVQDRDGRDLLLNAVTHGHRELARVLVEQYGCKVQTTDARGLTPLHMAAIHDHVDSVKELIAIGVDVDARDQWGNTPLMRAVYYYDPAGEGRAILALLAAGADPDIANEHGVSPRSLAFGIDNTDVRKFFEPKGPK